MQCSPLRRVLALLGRAALRRNEFIVDENTFYHSHGTRSIEEWADYITTEHAYCNPEISVHTGRVGAFFNNPNLRGFVVELELPDGAREKTYVTTRYMARAKYMALERMARAACDFNAQLAIEGVLGYDGFGAQITQIERAWIEADGIVA